MIFQAAAKPAGANPAGAADIVGKITKPTGVAGYDTSAGGIGLLLFISNVIQLMTVIAGIWVLFNILTAGYLYITGGGDSGAANKVRDKITQSVIGLLIIIGAYTIVALLGAILFKNPSYFLNPVLQGPTP